MIKIEGSFQPALNMLKQAPKWGLIWLNGIHKRKRCCFTNTCGWCNANVLYGTNKWGFQEPTIGIKQPRMVFNQPRNLGLYDQPPTGDFTRFHRENGHLPPKWRVVLSTGETWLMTQLGAPIFHCLVVEQAPWTTSVMGPFQDGKHKSTNQWMD